MDAITPGKLSQGSPVQCGSPAQPLCAAQLSQPQQMLGSVSPCPHLVQTPGLAVLVHPQASDLLTLEAADGG